MTRAIDTQLRTVAALWGKEHEGRLSDSRMIMSTEFEAQLRELISLFGLHQRVESDQRKAQAQRMRAEGMPLGRPPKELPTREQLEAKLAERHKNGRRVTTLRKLAKELKVSRSTLQRRLGIEPLECGQEIEIEID